MPHPAFPAIAAVAAALRSADQALVAGVPLIAAAGFGAAPATVASLVALQSAAWLAVSLPAGLAVDRAPALGALRLAALAVAGGLAGAAAGLGAGRLAVFATGCLVAQAGIVTALLAEAAAVQRLVQGAHLPLANARLQMIQSAATLLAPLGIGAAVAGGTSVAALCALAVAGAVAAALLPVGALRAPVPARARRPLAELAEGLRFVRTQPLLRAIAACAVLWNMAFFMLLAVFVPLALGPWGMTATEAGAAQAMMGAGAILAALAAAPLLARLEPRGVLVFGPASSAVAAAVMPLLAPVHPGAAAGGLFLVLGFGPVLWLICQTSIRQLVTPPGLIGRAGSVIQTAIYGVRPLGALMGGLWAAQLGTGTALWAVAALFALSAASALASPLARLRRMPGSVLAAE